MTISSISRSARVVVNTLRDSLQERREAVAAYKALEQELSSYTTRREVDDLLGSIRDEDGPDAQHIRDILLNNLHPMSGLHRAA